MIHHELAEAPARQRRRGALQDPAETDATSRWRTEVPYWPALDGLRGLAVAAVLLFHAEPAWLPGGFLGVSLFFTLSGFLITSLALAEHSSTGRVGLTTFWVRRIRRLVPASLLALVLATAVTLVAVPFEQRVSAMGDIRAAALNVANWRFVAQDAPYATLDLVPSPVQHYWSLAVEEQFYLVFPLLAAIALRWRARGLGTALATVAVLSVGMQLLLPGQDRVYFGTDTRAAELAVGGLLAVAWPRLRDLVGSNLPGFAAFGGTAALVATAVMWRGVDQQARGLYEGGLAAVAVVSALLILGAVGGAHRRPLSILRWAPLVQLGRISYGVYLFHFPLFLLISEERTGLPALALLAARLSATLLVAAVSFRSFETPIRVGTVLPGRRAVVLAGAAAAVVLATLPASHVAQPDRAVASDVLAEGIWIDPARPVEPSISSTTAGRASPEHPQAPLPVEALPSRALPPPLADADPPAPADPAPARNDEPQPARAPRIVMVGDSTAAAAGRALRDWGVTSGRLEVTTVSSPGCAVLHGPRFKIREGYTFEPKACSTLFSTAAAEARRSDVDAIVVLIGSPQLADWHLLGREGWQHFGTGDYEGQYIAALRSAAQSLATAGVPVLWADVPVPAWDLERFGQMQGFIAPGSGPVTMNDPARTALLNAIDGEILAGVPLVQRWPYAAALAGPDGRISTDTRPDGLHVSPEAMAAAAERGLYDSLAGAYRAVIGRHPAGLGPPESHFWS